MRKLTKDEKFYLPDGFDVQFTRIVKPWWQILDTVCPIANTMNRKG